MLLFVFTHGYLFGLYACHQAVHWLRHLLGWMTAPDGQLLSDFSAVIHIIIWLCSGVCMHGCSLCWVHSLTYTEILAFFIKQLLIDSSTTWYLRYVHIKLIRKQWATLHELDDVMQLIKRCHTVRSQFADELNRDIRFQGWMIRRSQRSWLTLKIKIMLFLHVRDRQAHCSSHSYLIRRSVFCLSSFSLSGFWHLPLLPSIQPLIHLGIPVMASKGKVRGEFCPAVHQDVRANMRKGAFLRFPSVWDCFNGIFIVFGDALVTHTMHYFINKLQHLQIYFG